MNIDPTLDVTPSASMAKSVEILNLLAITPDLSQRAIASRSGVSLGMVNLVLRRLTRTGCIKIVNLDRRKVSYMLTSKGLAEKAARSYHYFIRSIRVYQKYQQHIERVIGEQMAKGKTEFAIHGEGEIADLVRLVLDSKGSAVHYRLLSGTASGTSRPGEVILRCGLHNQIVDGVSILEELLKTQSQGLRGENHAD